MKLPNTNNSNGQNDNDGTDFWHFSTTTPIYSSVMNPSPTLFLRNGAPLMPSRSIGSGETLAAIIQEALDLVEDISFDDGLESPTDQDTRTNINEFKFHKNSNGQ